ncbi:hypothetical protein [Noviherbaspirillum pedocola]|uniref:Uncharacterized protein n=1 Tax=Noviherbaspirillum pedocola TaxID=2801341 RepID=A0A934W3R4_9BURK|nr:hypothetical protein [Noviherbaspirillum pedocola]MBK4733122.1 hypothetical protein [Noviherbaspirillum pedocola]
MPSIDFAPRWVLVIFFLSLCEAIGLAIYFHADITDPETASMQPAYLEAQGDDTMMAVGSNCSVDKPGVAKGNCRQEAHEIMQARKRQEQDRPTRHVESRHPQPVQTSHHG